jgi:enterochelin esterase family protein
VQKVPLQRRNRTYPSLLCALLLLTGGIAARAVQAQPPPPLRSPEVHSDRRVTFRLRAPNAKAVTVAREGAQPLPMTKDDKGVWSVTTEPLEPDLYGYSFVVDGVGLIDPANALMKPNLLNTQSMVHVPGASLPWEVSDVPRGMVHRHFYKSGIIGDHRDFYVYTPPGYEAGKGRYPVLYLLHGYSDDASGWTAVGRAHIIMDNLIAQGKAKPMLVVMPLGYGAPEVVSPGAMQRFTSDLWKRNNDKFEQALIAEVIPMVEKTYRVIKDRKSRAIAGLSMGGGEAISAGLNNLGVFAYVGSFSGAFIVNGNIMNGSDFSPLFPKLSKSDRSRLAMLWIGCGTEDFLINSNRKMRDWLKTTALEYDYVETPGAHTWMVWRRYLATFAPKLFR